MLLHCMIYITFMPHYDLSHAMSYCISHTNALFAPGTAAPARVASRAPARAAFSASAARSSPALFVLFCDYALNCFTICLNYVLYCCFKLSPSLYLYLSLSLSFYLSLSIYIYI